MMLRRHPRAGPRKFPQSVYPQACMPARAGMMSRLMLFVIVLTTASLVGVASAQAPEATFEIRIEKGRVPASMRLIRVRQGDAVKLRWTTDRPIALHLHGYDIEVKAEPGAVAEMVFTARATGRFPVEEHKSNAKGGHSHGEAPIVRIEVRPR